MRIKATPLHRMSAAALAIVGIAVGLLALLAPTPAAAQFPLFGWGSPPPPPRRAAPPPRQQQFSPFGGLFQPQPAPRRYRAPSRPRRDIVERAPPPPVDASKAPPARKPEGVPTTNVVVLGDSMADWMAYGLEDAYSDDSDIGVVRKVRTNSGLIRNESRSESYDAVQSAREILAAEKADFVVVMLGLADRQAIRERPPPKPPAPAAQPGSLLPPPPVVVETPQGPTLHEFRSEKWAELYGKRVDDMIAALKAKGVPVLWVGLPIIRGARGKAEVQYLNEIYRSHAEKAGITYVDVWDGFADDDGEYAQFGPDYDGQTRRLRSADGVHFTKAGALKLGHLVERELQRLMQARTAPVALPAPEKQAPTVPGVPAPRPDAGPVVPLGALTSEPEGLAGAAPSRAPVADPVAARVLVKGETLAASPGRADDFAWPRPDATADANDVIPIIQPAPAAARPVVAPAAKKTPTPAHRLAPKRPGQAAANAPPQPQVR